MTKSYLLAEATFKIGIGVGVLTVFSNTDSEKSGDLNFSMKIFYVMCVLYKFKIWFCMEYCYYVWAVVSNYYLDMLDKL